MIANTANSPTNSFVTKKARTASAPKNKVNGQNRSDIDLARKCAELDLIFDIDESMLTARRREEIKKSLGIESNHSGCFSCVSNSGKPDAEIIEGSLRLLNNSLERNPLSMLLYTAVQAGKIGRQELMINLLFDASEKLGLTVPFLIESVFVDRDRGNTERKGFNFLIEVAYALSSSCMVWLVSQGANLEVTNSYGETIPDILIAGLKNTLKKGVMPQMALAKFNQCFEALVTRVARLRRELGSVIDIEIPDYVKIGKKIVGDKRKSNKKTAFTESSKPKPKTKKAEANVVVEDKPPEPVARSAFSALLDDSDDESDAKEPVKVEEVTVAEKPDEPDNDPGPTSLEEDDDWTSVKKKKKGSKALVNVDDSKTDEAKIDELVAEFKILATRDEVQAFVAFHEGLKRLPKSLRDEALSRIE